MTRFATFATLYMMALFLEPAEKWHYPAFTATLLLLGAALAFAGLTRRTLPIFLVLATAQPLLTTFPDVANHVNVEIVCNLLLLVAIAYSLVHRDRYPTDEDCFELVRPVLQASMVLVYVIAGFAKLNTDFLDPAVSCVGSMMRDLRHVAALRAPGAPVGVYLVLGLAFVVASLLTPGVGSRPVRPALRAAAFALIALPGTLALRLAPGMPDRFAALAITLMAGVVIFWELGGGLLLTVPRFQGWLLAFSWSMHAMLSFIGFVHFGALAFALLFTFVPAPYMDMMTGGLRLPIVGRTVPRACAYFAIGALAGIVSGLGEKVPAAMLFNAGVVVLIWPVLRALAAQGPRPAWAGVPIGNRRTPRWMYALPALLALLGTTSYLGLRTAGNFTMFSNLRTEGPRSNHLLLGANPLKLWHYQEDAVRFTRFDDRLVPAGYRGESLEGGALPAVEFRKWIYRWTEEGRTVPLAFEYAGQAHSTDNIVTDPQWRTNGSDWAMRLMDFRIIQPEGPNRCRW